MGGGGRGRCSLKGSVALRLKFALAFALRSLGRGRKAGPHPGHVLAELQLLIHHPAWWGVSLSVDLGPFPHGWLSTPWQTNAWRGLPLQTSPEKKNGWQSARRAPPEQALLES